jgi:hypothetical protein
MRISTAAMLVLLATLTFMPAESSEITTIGAVEDILLMPRGVKLQARIDTGAAYRRLMPRLKMEVLCLLFTSGSLRR